LAKVARREEHPARYFREQKLQIVLGDDNPVQTRSLLSNERRVLNDELGFSEQDLDELDYVSVHAAFVDDGTRQHFVAHSTP
jgi:adenosine deaminase